MEGDIRPTEGHALVLYDTCNLDFREGGKVDTQWQRVFSTSLHQGLFRLLSRQCLLASLASAPDLAVSDRGRKGEIWVRAQTCVAARRAFWVGAQSAQSQRWEIADHCLEEESSGLSRQPAGIHVRPRRRAPKVEALWSFKSTARATSAAGHRKPSVLVSVRSPRSLLGRQARRTPLKRC